MRRSGTPVRTISLLLHPARDPLFRLHGNKTSRTFRLPVRDHNPTPCLPHHALTLNCPIDSPRHSPAMRNNRCGRTTNLLHGNHNTSHSAQTTLSRLHRTRIDPVRSSLTERRCRMGQFHDIPLPINHLHHILYLFVQNLRPLYPAKCFVIALDFVPLRSRNIPCKSDCLHLAENSVKIR